MQPLTHHEIIGLVEPFVRRGRHLDLAASKRGERKLVFEPAPYPGPPASTGTLTLENPHEGRYKLTLELRAAGDGAAGPAHAERGAREPLVARLWVDGSDVEAMLSQLESVPASRPFVTGDGFAAALVFEVEAPEYPRARAPHSADAAVPRLVLNEATAQVGDFGLHFRLPRVRTMAAEIELAAPAAAGDPPAAKALPEDIVAVIGWDWSPVHFRRGAWAGKIRLRGKEPGRSAAAESKLKRTLEHLAATLAAPPARFHEQHVWARWTVVLRRAIPLLTAFGLVAGVLLMPRLELDEASPLRMFVFHLPTLLLAIAFMMQELPRFEIPPLPRRLRLSHWGEKL